MLLSKSKRSRSLNWDPIRDDLVIGSCPYNAADLKYLRIRADISAVLSVQDDECLEKLEIDYPKLVQQGHKQWLVMERSPMRDFDREDQVIRLPNAVRVLHRLLSQRHCVYLHCTAGINRSPLVALAYMTWVEGHTLDETMLLLRDARPVVYPYLDVYEDCFNNLVKSHADRIQQRTEHLGDLSPGRNIEIFQRRAEREIIREVLIGHSKASRFNPLASKSD